jgi:hypothetical protein
MVVKQELGKRESGRRDMLSVLDRSDFRAAALDCGIPAERFARLADHISIWAASEDSSAAFAECTVLGWKP